MLDVTCPDMFASSYAALIGGTIGTIAGRAGDLKLKYQDSKISHHFVPIVIETSSVLGTKASSFLLELGRCIKEKTGQERAMIAVEGGGGDEVSVVSQAIWQTDL